MSEACTCGHVLGRPENMGVGTSAAYDAIFPSVLNWAPEDDCDSGEQMRDISQAAATAVLDVAIARLVTAAQNARSVGDSARAIALTEAAARVRELR